MESAFTVSIKKQVRTASHSPADGSSGPVSPSCCPYTPSKSPATREKLDPGGRSLKDVRYLYPLQHRSAVGHVGKRVNVGVNGVLVHLLGPLGRDSEL